MAYRLVASGGARQLEELLAAVLGAARAEQRERRRLRREQHEAVACEPQVETRDQIRSDGC